MKKIAVLKKWNGDIIVCKVKKEWIDGITAAIRGQFYYADNKNGYAIKGFEFNRIDVYEKKIWKQLQKSKQLTTR